MDCDFSFANLHETPVRWRYTDYGDRWAVEFAVKTWWGFSWNQLLRINGMGSAPLVFRNLQDAVAAAKSFEIISERYRMERLP